MNTLRQTNLRTMLLILTSLLLFLTMNVAYADDHAEVVATGLNNPRGMMFAPDGSLYITEAGIGGDGPCFTGAEGENCYGTTGAIKQIQFATRGEGHVITTIQDSLPSLALTGDSAGANATGAHDVHVTEDGSVYVVMGLGGAPSLLETEGALETVNDTFGRVIVLGGVERAWTEVANLAAYEGANDPDGAGADSNPYSFVLNNGIWYVSDAGGNTLIAIDGTTAALSTEHVFPVSMEAFGEGTIPSQHVPTGTSLGPIDDAVYVGQLTGFPFPVGGASVGMVDVSSDRGGSALDGFTHIMDLGYDMWGNLYVIELAKSGLLSMDLTGALIKVAPDGTRAEIDEGLLTAPTGLAVSPAGDRVCVAHNGMFPGAGTITCYNETALAVGLDAVSTAPAANMTLGVLVILTLSVFTLGAVAFRKR